MRIGGYARSPGTNVLLGGQVTQLFRTGRLRVRALFQHLSGAGSANLRPDEVMARFQSGSEIISDGPVNLYGMNFYLEQGTADIPAADSTNDGFAAITERNQDLTDCDTILDGPVPAGNLSLEFTGFEEELGNSGHRIVWDLWVQQG